MKPRRTGSVYRRKLTWWIKYYDANGKPRRESSHSHDKRVAEALLRKLCGEVASGKRVIGADLERTTFEDLERMILDDYRLQKRKSIAELQSSLRALKRYFAGWKARDISYDQLTAYAAQRSRAPATIARELAQLHHAFVLAERSGKAECPPFPTITVDNARRGFFEEAEWRTLREHLPLWYQHIGDFAFLTGWRLMEVMRLE